MTSRPRPSAVLATPRERIWAAVQKLVKGFTLWEVQDACDPMVNFNTVQSYMRGLVRSGCLEEVNASELKRGCSRTRPTFNLVKRSHEPPRVDIHGKEVTRGMGVLAMWRAMQVLKSFDFRDITRAATLGPVVVSETTARMYVDYLFRAGYLKQLQVPTPQRPGLYKLIRYTGPHAPAITRRKVVMDRNTGEFVDVQTAQEVCDAIE